MKTLSAILAILLLAAIGMIIKLKQEQPTAPPAPPPKPAPVVTTPKGPQLTLLLHLDEPVSTLQRFYELFPGAKIDELDIGDNTPGGPLAKKIAKELGLPLISGEKPFPRALLDKLIAENKEGQFLHYSNIVIGDDSLGIGSKATSPKCKFTSNNGKPGDPVMAQVIPWVKLPSDPKPTYEKALQLGFEPCATFNDTIHKGYVVDPQGFLILMQEAH